MLRHLCCSRRTATQSCVELANALPFDVDSGILVPGNDLPTVWADPLILAELQLAEVSAAMAAGLTGRIPLVDEDEMFSLLCQFILEFCTEHPKPIVHGRLPKVQGLGQASQIKILYTHGTVGVGYPPALLVDKVLPLIGNVLLEHLNLV